MFVTLADSDRWSLFRAHNNEMIVAKKGRSMFPRLVYEFEGLDPEGRYVCIIEFQLMSMDKLKLKDGQWVADTSKKVEAINNISYHTSKVLSGVKLMTEGINYSKLKLTNCPAKMIEKNVPEWVHLESQMRYIPVLSLYQQFDGYPDQLVGQFRFAETEFVTVTAYQSKTILEMKKLNNDYAKSFRAGNVELRGTGAAKKRKMEEKENKVSKRGKLDNSLGEDSEKDGEEEVGEQVQYPSPQVPHDNDQQLMQQPYHADQMVDQEYWNNEKEEQSGAQQYRQPLQQQVQQPPYQADQMVDQLSWTWQRQQDYEPPQGYQPQYDGAYPNQGDYNYGYMYNPYNV